MAIGNEMMANAETLGTLLSREEGKPLAEGKGEVFRAGQFFTYYAAECLRQIGEKVNLPTAGTDYHVPFGGRGDSSYGPREQGKAAAEFYTIVKTAYISSGVPQD